MGAATGVRLVAALALLHAVAIALFSRGFLLARLEVSLEAKLEVS